MHHFQAWCAVKGSISLMCEGLNGCSSATVSQPPLQCLLSHLLFFCTWNWLYSPLTHTQTASSPYSDYSLLVICLSHYLTTATISSSFFLSLFTVRFSAPQRVTDTRRDEKTFHPHTHIQDRTDFCLSSAGTGPSSVAYSEPFKSQIKSQVLEGRFKLSHKSSQWNEDTRG